MESTGHAEAAATAGDAEATVELNAGDAAESEATPGAAREARVGWTVTRETPRTP